MKWRELKNLYDSLSSKEYFLNKEIMRALTIEHEGRSYQLSPGFLTTRDAWKNLEKIKTLIFNKLKIYSQMQNTDDRSLLKALAKKVEANELKIQKNFNLRPDKNFHRFWEMPKCSCPWVDNSDYWGSPTSFHNSNCLIHGK